MSDEHVLFGGCVGTHGYGAVRANGRITTAHRAVYEAAHGELPPNVHVHHREDCPRLCINLAHLSEMPIEEHGRLHSPPGTRPEAALAATAARTHCRQGHPLDGLRDGGIHRYCRTCNRARVARNRRTRRNAVVEK